MANRWGNNGNSDRSELFLAPKSLQMVIAAMTLKDIYFVKESYDQSKQHIKKQRHYLANKAPYRQSYGFSSSHVHMWKLDHKGWAPKNWCFWIVVLEKILESPLDSKRSNQSILKEINSEWIFIGRTDAKTEALILWPPDANSRLTGKGPDAGKDWGQEEKGTTEDEMVGWHH